MFVEENTIWIFRYLHWIAIYESITGLEVSMYKRNNNTTHSLQLMHDRHIWYQILRTGYLYTR